VFAYTWLDPQRTSYSFGHSSFFVPGWLVHLPDRGHLCHRRVSVAGPAVEGRSTHHIIHNIQKSGVVFVISACLGRSHSATPHIRYPGAATSATSALGIGGPSCSIRIRPKLGVVGRVTRGCCQRQHSPLAVDPVGGGNCLAATVFATDDQKLCDLICHILPILFAFIRPFSAHLFDYYVCTREGGSLPNWWMSLSQCRVYDVNVSFLYPHYHLLSLQN
jgi:hypothetical protein